MSYHGYVVDALAKARDRQTVYAQLGTGVWTSLVFIADRDTLIVGSRITVESVKRMSRPPVPARLMSCSIPRMRRLAQVGGYSTVILVMSHINRGPKTWAAIAELVHNKRVLVVEGLN